MEEPSRIHRNTRTDTVYIVLYKIDLDEAYHCVTPRLLSHKASKSIHGSARTSVSAKVTQYTHTHTHTVHDSPWESRSFCAVFIRVIGGHPGGWSLAIVPKGKLNNRLWTHYTHYTEPDRQTDPSSAEQRKTT